MSDLLTALARRVLVVDGAMGTSIQARELSEQDFAGLDGCNEVLVRTRPDVIRDVHEAFLAVGCDAVETDTFGGAPWVLDEYGLGADTEELNERAARLARDAVAGVTGRDVGPFVLGSIGPGTRSPTLSLGKPAGADTIDYATMVAGYTRQARALLAGGADALVVETVFDLLQAKAAVWACHQARAAEGVDAPVLVSVTIEQGLGTMLLGTEVGAALAALHPLGIDVLGLNCATGPDDMREHVRTLAASSPLPLSVIPNAGIPRMVDGAAEYPLTPDALAAAQDEFVREQGVALVGGCCGTTPEHLAAVVAAVGVPPGADGAAGREVAPRAPAPVASLASLYSATPIEQDTSFLIVGERLNANGSKRFRELLLDGDVDGMAQMAREQSRGGAHTLDVCVDYVGRDGAEDMAVLCDRLATQSTLPLVIDSTEPEVIETALRRLGGRAVINSVNLEDGRNKLDVLLPMARQYGAAVVCLAIDEEGQARTAEWKIEVCRRIADIAIGEYGLAAEDLLFDTLTFPLGSGQEELRRDAIETLEAIEGVKAAVPGAHTVLGVSNVSFGLAPAARQALNSVFLHMAVERGLDAAIVHAGKILPLHQLDDELRTVCEDLVLDRRGAAGHAGSGDEYDPLARLMELVADAGSVRGPTDDLATLPLTERLQRRIVDAERDGLTDDLDTALAEGLPALDIVNEHLLAGMRVVGDLFGSGQMQLPFVLQSAEVMKSAVAHLEPHMERVEGGGKGRIVLATVKGDVHDIGKNLVDIILSNNGYDVRNIGIKQPIDAIVAAAEEFDAHAIGLSGLLVKSTLVMRDDLDELGRRGLAHYPVLLGGAALTRGFVEGDLRRRYDGPLFYCPDAFAGLNVMDELVAHRSAGGPPPTWGTEPVEAPVRRAAPTPSQPTSGRSDVADDVPVPTPPFWGPRTQRGGVALDDLVAMLNTVALFRNQWGFGRDDTAVAEEALRATLDRVRSERLLHPSVSYGYFPCVGDGNDVILFAAPDSDEEVARFSFPRQSGERRLCIADFFRSRESGVRDVIALQCVTMGPRVTERATELFEQDRFTDYLYLHGLGVEMAEALAELWHARVRRELGIAGADASDVRSLFKQGYQGSRYSFGYAACPDLSQRAAVVDLLRAEDIGVELSESFQLHPEQSTDALIVHHPEARYFNAR